MLRSYELLRQLQATTEVRVSRATTKANSSKTQTHAQKKTLHATERETERVQQLRVQYWQATFWERVFSPKSWRTKLEQ